MLLFGATEYDGTHGGRALAYIIASTGVNAVVEMIVATLITGAVTVALRKARLI